MLMWRDNRVETRAPSSWDHFGRHGSCCLAEPLVLPNFGDNLARQDLLVTVTSQARVSRTQLSNVPNCPSGYLHQTNFLMQSQLEVGPNLLNLGELSGVSKKGALNRYQIMCLKRTPWS